MPVSPPVQPSNLVKYFDFETSAAGWETLVKWDEKFGNPQPILSAATPPPRQVERGVAYALQLSQGVWLDYTIQYESPVQADVIVAQFYLPDTPDIEANWVGIAAVDGTGGPWLAGSGDDIPLGQWTQLVLDLRDKYDSEGAPLSARPFFIQAVYILKGRNPLNSTSVVAGLDNVAFYQASGYASIREQRGTNRTLFDFEDESIWPWQVGDNRIQTDTLTLSSDQVYRGGRALKWDTQIEAGGEVSVIRSVWSGSPPQGGWIAQLYLPTDIPKSAIVWANFYTYSSSGWQGSAVHNLKKGSWNTLVWDTHDIEWDQGEIVVGIQIGTADGSYEDPIYIDDIQIFEK